MGLSAGLFPCPTPAQVMRRILFLLLFMISFLGLMWLGWWRWLNADGRFLLLLVWENNTGALNGRLLTSSPWPEAVIDQEGHWLYLPGEFSPGSLRRILALGKKPEVLVLQRIDSLDTHLSSRPFWIWQPPEIVPLLEPVQWEVVEPDGPTPNRRAAVENRERLLAGNLKLLEIGSRGEVKLDYGGNAIQLLPGDSWGELRIEKPDGRVVALTGDWEKEATAALDQKLNMTRLTVHNLGWWEWSRVRPK